jgi:hypothetical protein
MALPDRVPAVSFSPALRQLLASALTVLAIFLGALWAVGLIRPL